LTRTPLTPYTLAKNVVVFTSIGSILGIALLLVLYGIYCDRRGEALRAKRLAKAGAMLLVESVGDFVLDEVNPMVDEAKRNGDDAPAPTGANPSGSESDSNGDLDEAEEGDEDEDPAGTTSVPDFAVKPFWRLVVETVGQRHQWFSVLVVYKKNVPRSVRVAMIVTAILTVMFFNAGRACARYVESQP
jgi:hypothetical protein